MFGKLNLDMLRGKKIAVHCPTQEYANYFCEQIAALYPENKRWVTENYWDRYQERTCYWFEILGDERLSYCNIEWFLEKGYEVLEFRNVFESPVELPIFEGNTDIKSLFGME